MNSLSVVDVKQDLVAITQYYNAVVSSVNDHVVRVSLMFEPFYWHYHPNSDETFLSLEGGLIIQLEDKDIELLPGQLFTVPANIRHRTRPIGERSLNFTFERADAETVRVSDL